MGFAKTIFLYLFPALTAWVQLNHKALLPILGCSFPTRKRQGLSLMDQEKGEGKQLQLDKWLGCSTLVCLQL